MEGQTNYIEKKDQEEPTMLLTYNGESEEKTLGVLAQSK